MNYHVLLQKVEEYVILLFAEHKDARLFYHNLSHTKEVVDTAKKIAVYYELDERSWFIVCAAAWFYGTGYIVTNNASQELKSAELAGSFLKSIEVNDDEIEEIKHCIMATQIPQQPTTLPEKIVCDADMSYLGVLAFKEKSKLLRKETEALNNIKIDAEEWRADTIKMLETHIFHTDYCRLYLDKNKAENLGKLKSKQQQKLSDAINNPGYENNTANMLSEDGNKPVNKKMHGTEQKDRPQRGVESMFRIAATNNVRVSSMADNKAHILITVNAIIISVILGITFKSINENTTFLIPTIILLTVSVLTVIYSILATRPKISNGLFTQEQVEKKSVNLLYFGSYYKMSFNEYRAGVKAMIKDSDFLYGALTKDLYWQGKVLGRKYKLLHTAYSIFMYGLIVSVLAFAAALFLN